MSDCFYAVKDKIQRILAHSYNGVEVYEDGSLGVPFDTATVSVLVVDREQDVIVKVAAPIAEGLTPHDSLFRWLALHAGDMWFGSFEVGANDDRTMDVGAYHCLLGDYLDPQELLNAVEAIATLTTQLAPELPLLFGASE